MSGDTVVRVTRVLILGSTGSIGVQALDVVDGAPDMQCVGLACGTRVDEMRAQATTRGVAHTSAAAGGGSVPYDADLGRLMDEAGPDIVLNALVGVAGLRPTLAAIERGIPVALANKESLVAGGDLVRAAREVSGARLVPVDSEHSALFQLLEGVPRERVHRCILTASGGPFRGRTAADMEGVLPGDALAHPTWDMGAKITIDSATMMNKGLEVIEAHAKGARRAIAGNMDGIEILGAFGYLPQAFLSPLTNHRKDDYGGSLENRLRFLMNLLESVRAVLGKDKVLGVRLPGDAAISLQSACGSEDLSACERCLSPATVRGRHGTRP